METKTEPKLKEICLKCGYWDRSKKTVYRCYTPECPAHLRDMWED